MRTVHGLLMVLGLVSGCGGGDPLDGEYGSATLSGTAVLSDRQLQTTRLPSLSVPLAMSGGPIVIAHDRSGALTQAISFRPSTRGYLGEISIVKTSGNAIQNDAIGSLQTPGTEPGSSSSTANYRIDGASGTIALAGNALTITLVGDTVRTFDGVVGTDFPDGLSETGTISLTITAARVPK